MKGHIVKRGRHSWRLVLDAPRDGAGKRKQLTGTIQGSRAEAEKALRNFIQSIEEGTYVRPSSMTVGEYLEQWLEGQTGYLAPKTLSSYRFLINHYIQPTLGKMQLARLELAQIESCYNRLLSNGLSGRTVVHTHRVLSKALSDAVRLKKLTKNVAREAKLPKIEKGDTNVLTVEQVGHFLDNAKSTPFYELFVLGFYSGLRRGEILGLRWKDIHFERRKLCVNQTVQRVDGKVIVGPPKTENSRRMITLSGSICDVLRDKRARLLLQGLPTREDDFIFTRFNGLPLDPDTVTHAFTKITREAKLPHCRFHDMRHIHVSMLIEQGEQPKLISERLGHSNIGITMNLYGHLMDGMDEAAAERLDARIKNALRG